MSGGRRLGHTACPVAGNPVREAIPDMPQRHDFPGRGQPGPSSTAAHGDRLPVKVPRSASDDRFFSHIVSSMRNGVIAFRRDGTLALMNDEAYRIFGLTRDPRDVGRPFSDVLRERPEIIRVLSGTFEMSHLPNRAELRLKDLDRVIGYTLSQVKDSSGVALGAVMFFKDLTQVEQTDLAQVLHQAVTLAESKAPRGGVVVAIDMARELPMIAGDQHQLTQVFTNLVANAFEALDGKGHLTITAATIVPEDDPAFPSPQPPMPLVLVDIADDGPGIPSDLADRIFDPFFTTK